MNRLLLSTLALFFIKMTCFSQVSISGGSDVNGSYPTLAAAVGALNGAVITGPVTVDVIAGHVETTDIPEIDFTGNDTAPVVIQKSGMGANPLINKLSPGTIASSTTLGAHGDGIIIINGGDFITFDGIDLSTDSDFIGAEMMEYGYYLKKATGEDACKDVTIKNATITLNKMAVNSYGIYVSNISGTANVTVTSEGGRSENIKIYGNTITNSYGGIQLRGFNHTSAPYEFLDQNIEIGEDGGNIISNFGGLGTAVYPIYTIYQNQCKINNNNIVGGDGSTGIMYGIFTASSNNGSYDIDNNTISLRSDATTQLLVGIYNGLGTTGHTTSVLNVRNNTVTNFSRPLATSGATYFIYSTSNYPTQYNILNNEIGNSSFQGTGALYGIYNISQPGQMNVDGNTISNITRTATNATSLFYGISTTGSSTNHNATISKNEIFAITGFGSTGVVGGINFGTVNQAVVFQNKIYDISSNHPSAQVYGINLTSVADLQVYNNLIGDLKTPETGDATATNPKLRGINISTAFANSTRNIYFNTIHLNASSTGDNFGSSAIFATTSTTSTTSNLTLRNNIIVNNSIASGSGNTVALQRSTTSLDNFNNDSNNNLLYAGVSGPQNLIFFDGTNSDETLADYKCRVEPAESLTVTELPPFLSINGLDSDFLHIDPTVATRVESGALPIVDTDTDFNGIVRDANNPDIGAVEGDYIVIDGVGPLITYETLLNTICLYDRELEAEISDFSGVDNTSGQKPRLWYKKSTEDNVLPAANNSSENGWKWVEASNSSSPYEFTFDFSLLNSMIANGDVIQYFIVAQDLAMPSNVGTSVAKYNDCLIPTSVALSSDLFPITETNEFNLIDLPSEVLSIASPDNVCIINDITLTLSTGDFGAEYQWEQSPVGANMWTPIPGANTASYTVEDLTESMDFRCIILCDGVPVSDISPSSIVTVTVSSPEILSTIPGLECGPGPISVALGATASLDAEILWYENETQGQPVAMGEVFNTPPITASTTYWVAASEGGGTEDAAKPTYEATVNTSGNQWGLVFDVINTDIVINSVEVYSVGTGGQMTVELRDATGTLINSVGPFSYPPGSTANPVPVTFNLDLEVPIGTGYRLVSASMSGALIRETSNNNYPYVSASGNVAVTSGFITNPGSNTYYWFYNWQVSTGCETPRIPVEAIILNDDPICPDDFSVCIDAEPFDLTGATPDEGIYSGPGVVDGVFDPSIAGTGIHVITYTVCDLTCQFEITVVEIDATVVVDESSGIENNDGIICAEDEVTITANGGSSYQWSNGAETSAIIVSPIENTVYTVTITEGDCFVVESVEIIVNPVPTAPMIIIMNNECPDLEGSISANDCDHEALLEWALDENGPWSDLAPEYSDQMFTVYARCNNDLTGCISMVSSASTAPQECVEPCSDLMLQACDEEVLEDFTGFEGTGFALDPAPGQLCATPWALSGFNAPAKDFGEETTALNYARGNTPGGVTTGGLYSLNSGAIWIQPTGTVFAPGSITLRIQNNTGEIIESIDLAYDILVLNDQPRSNSFNFSYSQDNIGYTNIAALDYTSPGPADVNPTIVTVTRNTLITGLNIPDGGYIYLRWSGADAGGSGSRDEFGLDNITVAVPCPCPNFTDFTPNSVVIVDSECTEGCQVGGGTISVVDNCPERSSMVFSVDNGMTWSTVLPTYNQEGPSQTIITRCDCDEDNLVVSAESAPMTTLPGECTIPDAPMITIINNECPSETGSISATGCDGPDEILEWALDENGPWSETAPAYTDQSFSVYARCIKSLTECASEVTSAITNPEECIECPLIEIVEIIQECTDGQNYDLLICFTADNVGESEFFEVEVGTMNFGLFTYGDNQGDEPLQYCLLLTGFIENVEEGIEVKITHLGSSPPAPSLDGSATVETEWGSAVAVSDGIAGWAGVNVGDLYVTSDLEYVYFGVNFNSASDWQSWGFAINTVDGSGGSSEVWTYPIIYGHSELPDYVVKGNFTGYAELREWDGSTWNRTDNNGNDAGLNSMDFAANHTGMVELRIRRSILGDPSQVEVQFYVSGNNENEHATFDAVPDDEVATSWNHNGQGGNPGPTTLQNYCPPVGLFAQQTCCITGTYDEQSCIECPNLAPIVADINYCVGDDASPLTAVTNFNGTLVWYDEDPVNNPIPLAEAPTPDTSIPGLYQFWVTEELNDCEGPAALIFVTVGQVDIISITQQCVNPNLFDLEICFENQFTGASQSFMVMIDDEAYGPFDYDEYGNEVTPGVYCITIEGAGITNPLNDLTITVKDNGDAPFNTPGMDGSFDGDSVWGSAYEIADGLAGWAGANAKALYLVQDEDYLYLGAEVEADSWQAWAFIINTTSGGGTFDSWSRSIDYAHTDAPDYIFRGTFGGYAEFHTWAGAAWTGYFGQPASEYGVSTTWVEARILKSEIGNPENVQVQFYITGDNNDHGSFDAVPDDNNAMSWNESGNRTQLSNYAQPYLLAGQNSVMCMAMETFTPESCGEWFISDPCVCSNDATTAGGDGTFSEEITVTGPAGQTIMAVCAGCSPAILSFTEGAPGVYVSQLFTHVDNIGYSTDLFADGEFIGTIGNKCAYPQVSIDPFGPVANCRNQQDFPLTATVIGDDGSGEYTWSGVGVDNDNMTFNPANFTPGFYTIDLLYDGVFENNISPDGGLTAAYPGCVQPAQIQIEVIQTLPAPEVEHIEVCVGESTTIIPGVINPANGTMVSSAYDFDDIVEPSASVDSNPALMAGADAVLGSGVTLQGFAAGCGPVPSNAMNVNGWGEEDEAAAVANNNYFEFTISNTSPVDVLVITGFSFDERRSGTGPPEWALYNGTTPLGFNGLTTNTSSRFECTTHNANLNIELAPGESAAMRVYAWGNLPTQSSGSLRLDNVIVEASSVALPDNFKFYLEDPLENPEIQPVAIGSQYDPMTMPDNSPQSIWVTECAPDGCESDPTEVTVTVLTSPFISISPVPEICAPEVHNVTQIPLNENPEGGITTYHDTEMDADLGINPITEGLDMIGESRNIYVRYEINGGCYVVGLIELIVNPMPPAPDVDTEIIVCDGEEPLIEINVDNFNIAFFWDFENGINQDGTSSDPAIAESPSVQTLGSGIGSPGFQAAGSGCGNAITSAGYTGNSLADAISIDQYFEFCVGAVQAGFMLDAVTAINIRHRRSGTGPVQWAIVPSDNVNLVLVEGMLNNTNCLTQGGALNQNSTSSCYRVYYWDASGTGGTLRIDDFEILAQYTNAAIYAFYNLDPETNPDINPVFIGTSYMPVTTVSSSPDTVWITCTNPVTGCESEAVQVVVTVVELPSITVFNSCQNGPGVQFTLTGNPDGVWSVSGGGAINPATGFFTPSTPGCYTATFTTNTGMCTDEATFVVFPATPAAPVVENTCNASLVIPVLPVFAGFTAEYSFDGGVSYGTSNISATTPGCYQLRSRYVLGTECGDFAPGTLPPAACAESAVTNAIIFPAAPSAPSFTNACVNGIVVTPPVAVQGFVIQYSYDDGMDWTSSNTSPNTPGCYTIRTRYVTASACGNFPAGTAAPTACMMSAANQGVVFPGAPQISMPPATCMQDINLPNVASVQGFIIEYSINGGPFTTMPMGITEPGCYTISARYVLEETCGNTLAGSASSVQGCAVSNVIEAFILPIPNVLGQDDILVCPDDTVFVQDFMSSVNVPACLGVEIQFSWTNSNPNIGLPASGMGNIAPFLPANPGRAVITVTPSITRDGVICLGEPINFTILVHRSIAMACNGNLNITVDFDCALGSFVDMFLEGEYDVEFYDVVLTAGNGAQISPFASLSNFLNQTLMYSIVDICDGNRCWGSIYIEDKLPPVLECQNFDITCIDESRLYLQINNANFLGRPVATDNCGEVSLSYSDVRFGDNCGRTIFRRWAAIDASGNTAPECIQQININPIGFEDIFLPSPLVVVNCNEGTSPANLVTITGNVFDGYPFAFDDDGNLIAVAEDGLCNIHCVFTDQILDACAEGCHGNLKVLRTWTCVDWCSGQVSVPYTQLIKSVDLEGPTFSVKDTIVSTSPWNCKADFFLPNPWELHDNCDIAPKWWVTGPGVVTITNIDHPIYSFRATGAPKGEHVFLYHAEDCCGNLTVVPMTITVEDRTPPVAIAKQNIVISLVAGGPDTDGSAKLFAEHIDNGSYDMCGPVRLEIRRAGDAPACENFGLNEHNNNLTYRNFNNPSDNNNDTDNGEFVKFCCEDVNTEIPGSPGPGYHMVWLRVWDDGDMNGVFGTAGDNFNETWAWVKVEDKLAPVVQCPHDAAITCDWPIDQSSDFGGGFQNTDQARFDKTGFPTIYSTCPGNMLVEFQDRFTAIPAGNNCGLGRIVRTFRVTKDVTAHGGSSPQSVICTQIIDIGPSTSQQQWTITPPPAAPVKGMPCTGPTSQQVKNGGPTWVAGPCDVIGENIKIDTFLFEDGVCKKWVAEYNYMNWCTGESRGPFFRDFVYEDQVKPEFDECLADTCYTVDANCSLTGLRLQKTASDEGGCTDQGWLKWQVFIDLWADGTIDYEFTSFVPPGTNRMIEVNGVPRRQIYVAPTLNGAPLRGQGNQLGILIPEDIGSKFSKHKVEWKVTDGCHNHQVCVEHFTVEDKKPPTPYCVHISTALMENGMVELWAKDFDLGSFDNCTEQKDLKFTFYNWAPSLDHLDVPHYFDANGFVALYPTTNQSVLNRYAQGQIQRWIPDMNSSGKVFTCEDRAQLGNGAEVWVTVWDKALNFDWCVVILTMADNQGACGDNGGSRIEGEVFTEMGSMIMDAQVVLMAEGMHTFPWTAMTNEDGRYEFNDVPDGIRFDVFVEKDNDHSNGVSTLDLVLIQRHILGTQLLDSPYKLIAADVNNDNVISVSDLVETRRLILGSIPRFIKNSSWRFVKEDYEFFDPDSPWDMTEIADLGIMHDSIDMNVDFIGIKIGDVNYSAVTNSNHISIDTRNISKLYLEINDDELSVGSQIEVPVMSSNFEEVFGFQFSARLNGLVFKSVKPGRIHVDISNFGMPKAGLLTMSWNHNEAVIADSDEVLFTLVFEVEKGGSLSDAIKLGSDFTAAEAYKDGNLQICGVELTKNDIDRIKFSIMDMTGRVLLVKKMDASEGFNTIEFSQDELNANGVLIYQMETEDFVASRKMILIE
jgi:hypothetical protein